MGLYVRHARRGQYPALMRQSPSPRVVIVAARNEGERIDGKGANVTAAARAAIDEFDDRAAGARR
jgi:hypothetical protein